MPDERGTPPLTLDLMRSIAEAQGLDLSDDELTAMLPGVAVGRDPLLAAPEMTPETEPAARFTVIP